MNSTILTSAGTQPRQPMNTEWLIKEGIIAGPPAAMNILLAGTLLAASAALLAAAQDISISPTPQIVYRNNRVQLVRWSTETNSPIFAQDPEANLNRYMEIGWAVVDYSKALLVPEEVAASVRAFTALMDDPRVSAEIITTNGIDVSLLREQINFHYVIRNCTLLKKQRAAVGTKCIEEYFAAGGEKGVERQVFADKVILFIDEILARAEKAPEEAIGIPGRGALWDKFLALVTSSLEGGMSEAQQSKYARERDDGEQGRQVVIPAVIKQWFDVVMKQRTAPAPALERFKERSGKMRVSPLTAMAAALLTLLALLALMEIRNGKNR